LTLTLTLTDHIPKPKPKPNRNNRRIDKVDGSALIGFISQRLEEDIGVPRAQQSLHFHGKVLDATSTIEAAGLAHGDMIVLEGKLAETFFNVRR
jgi:hypothetical protein